MAGDLAGTLAGALTSFLAGAFATGLAGAFAAWGLAFTAGFFTAGFFTATFAAVFTLAFGATLTAFLATAFTGAGLALDFVLVFFIVSPQRNVHEAKPGAHLLSSSDQRSSTKLLSKLGDVRTGKLC